MKKGLLSKKEETQMQKDFKEEKGDLIHVNSARFQVIKYRPDILVPDNMNYEDLEELKVTFIY